MRQFRIWVLVLVMLLALSPSAGTAATLKHSGSVFSIANVGLTLVLAEAGPWQARDGATVITYRSITVTTDTELMVVRELAP
jgi:hypothetical protein